MNLLLIGYRGSGKTTVAAALAERLGWPWLDADAELERRAGKTIKQIFADEGETAFRDRESAVLADLLDHENNRIIALGGGVILREENRRLLAEHGKTVWLQASPEALHLRIHADPTTTERRPNLTGQGGLAEIRNLLAQRAGLYAASADVAIDTEGKSPDQLAGEIQAQLQL
jgi:shikimate kinase